MPFRIDHMCWTLGGLSITLSLGACATAPEIPRGTKTAATCIYDTLKTTPSISAVEVDIAYGSDDPLIEYEYRDGKGEPASTILVLSRPKDASRYQFEGDFMSSDNPVSGMVSELASKCGVDGYYVDQVILVDRAKRIEMWKQKVHPN